MNELKYPCVISPWAINSSGYPQEYDSLSGKRVSSHRLAWVRENGSIPPDRVIMHLCDNKRCIEPTHLKLGTQADNVADARAKGRTRGGSIPNNKHNATLLPSEVKRIRELYNIGLRQKDVAEMMGVSQALVSKIVNYHYWSEV